MNTEKKGDLIISGTGTSNGGTFEQALINGKGTINGTLDCTYFKCNGTGRVTGDVVSEKAKINGNAKINGKVSCINFTIEGTASIKEDVNIDEMTVRGKGSIGRNVKGEIIKVQGSITVGMDCEVEKFHLDGRFTINGLLSAEKIEMNITGDCKAGEIGGQTIHVRQKTNPLRNLLKPVFPIKLETDLIEGDFIELENTKARTVRGNHIIIGENCEVEFVEYKDSLRIDGNGRVNKSVQI
jgi:cytoskeletal protein CcmA (bactofilin family)